MSTKKTATVTPITELKKANEPEIVELPGFEPNTTIHFKLRRASLRAMATAGKIPNSLLAAAQRMYEGVVSSAKANFADMVKVMDIVVDSAMVEPTMQELKEAGVELTEDQFGQIWSYAQKGAAALIPFRGKPSGANADTNSKGMEDQAE